MDLRFTAEDEDFRKQIRASLAEALPGDIRDRVAHQSTQAAHSPDQRRWFAILDQLGWAAPHWPVEHGGTDWSPIRRFIFEDELHMVDAPEYSWGGTHMVGPIIYTFGSKEQQEKFLKPTRDGSIIWAQGFSEPGSGSDLASLRTNAKQEGDHFVVNGQKIWTSGAYEAEWGFFLVKTDLTVKPQLGMSFLLIKMDTPGITVRRIPQINDESHLCEVFLDNVIVPAENLIGEMGKGWTYGKFLLEHERTTSSFIFWSKRELRRAKRIAAVEMKDGVPLAEVPEYRARIARIEADLLALEWSVFRILANETYDYPTGVAASVLKVRGSELQQDITELHMDLLGARALRYFAPGPVERESDPIWPDYVPGRTSVALMTRATTIFGGAKQVQKNIIAKTAFGL